MTLANLPAPSFTGADLSQRVNAVLAEARAARRFASVAALLADATLAYGTGARPVAAGDRIETAEGHQYQVAAAGATDHHLATGAGGTVKLYVLAQNGELHDGAFGLAGNGTTDDTSRLQALLAIAGAARMSVRFRPLVYRHTDTLTATGVSIDGNGARFLYAGPPGRFAWVFNSTRAGSFPQQSEANSFVNFGLYQTDLTGLSTVTASTTYDPPSLPSVTNLGNIQPRATVTTVACPGALPDGYARAAFSAAVPGIELTAWVSAPDVVSVAFNNYWHSAIDLPSGTLSVTVQNKAIHGLCLGGDRAVVRGSVQGFTGVSVAVGNSWMPASFSGGGIDATTVRDVESGVFFPSVGRCYYCDIDVNIAPAAGWGLIVPDRSNGNRIACSTFGFTAWGDGRANCLREMVLSGVTNDISGTLLEGNPSEEKLLLRGGCNGTRSAAPVYLEYFAANAVPPYPRVRALRTTAENRLTVRHPYGNAPGQPGPVDDRGVNRIEVMTAAYINGQQSTAPAISRNLVENADFENSNGTYGPGTLGDVQGYARAWRDYSVVGTGPGPYAFAKTIAIGARGTGHLSGREYRLDLVDGRPSVFQHMHTHGRFNLAGLAGQLVTGLVWVNTNLSGVVLRIAGESSSQHPGTGTWQPLTVTLRLPSPLATLDFAVLASGSGPQTGFLRLSNAYLGLGWDVPALSEPAPLEGSATVNPPSVAAAAWNGPHAVPVLGARVGDPVLGVEHSLGGGLIWQGTVTSDDTVSAYAYNPTGAAIDLASGTLRARVARA